MVDNIEAIKKVTETMNKQSPNPAEDMERMSSNKEHFQSLIDNTQSNKNVSFERIDTKAFAVEESQNIESKPVFAEENVSTQKNGSATDQERRQGRQSSSDNEIGEVTATGSKQSSSSFIDEAGRSNSTTSPTSLAPSSPEAIQTQANEMVNQLDQVKTQLSQTQTEIKPGYQTLLRNRLTHIDDNLKIALSKVGVESPAASSTASTAGKSNSPLQRFISMVSDSQNNIKNMQANVEKMSAVGQISPGDMLTIQIKMNYIQQQIELFTSLLNKALESTKTIMNVQV